MSVCHKIKKKLLYNYRYFIFPGIKSRRLPGCRTQILTETLLKSGLRLVNLRIDVEDYKNYLTKANYHNFPGYYEGGRGGNFIEKSLEHYLAAELLEISKEDVYIDVAARSSPTAEIYTNLYRCKSFRQDLIFPPGVHDDKIGGDAAKLPVEDGFATKMALHCSFEHFEGDSDIRFIQEAGRVLRTRGKLCILPLYLGEKYIIGTNPLDWPKNGISFDGDAVAVFNKLFVTRHNRFYDVEHFADRIIKNMNGLDLTVYIVQNEKEVDRSCYVKFIAVFSKP